LLVHGELLAQGEVLEGELAVAAAEEGEETKQVEQESDHRTGIVSGPELTDQPLAAGRSFGEGQAEKSFALVSGRRRPEDIRKAYRVLQAIFGKAS
jgi:hypothetical protein